MRKLSKNLDRIVNTLNDGKFHDGTTLGEKFNMTRAGIWKAIKKLQDYGIEIESIKGKGYRLTDPLILLNKTTIKKGLQHKINVEVLETTNSTMDYFKTSNDHKKMGLCFAETQSAARGRFNRHWHTPFAQNISLSLRYPFAKDISQLAGLSIVVGLGLCYSLEKLVFRKPLQLKWPNDIIYDNKKLGGVLIEIEAESNGWCHAIIGFSINTNMQHQQGKQISQAWTSLREINKQYVDRNLLSIQLINDLLTQLEQFTTSGFKAFMPKWKTFDYLHNKNITLRNLEHHITGKAQGINEQGHLLLKTKNGKITACSSGDASIVKSPYK